MKLRELRKSRNMSQKDLAEMFNVAQNTISQWERGVRSIDSDTLLELSRFFNVSTDYLLGKSDDRMGGTSYATPVILKSSQAILDIIDTLSEDKKEKLLELAKMLQTVEEAEKGNKK